MYSKIIELLKMLNSRLFVGEYAYIVIISSVQNQQRSCRKVAF